MKLRELLTERISLSSYAPAISNGIFNHTRDVVSSLYNSNKTLMNTVESRRQLTRMIIDELNLSIPDLLIDYAMTYTGSSPIIKIEEFEIKGVNGAYIHEINTLKISKKFLFDISNLYVARLFKELNKQDFKIVTPLIRSKINEIASVFVHEMTHYLQFVKAGKERPRSYIYDKDQVTQYLTKQNLKTKKERTNNPEWEEGTTLQQINVYLAKSALDIKKNIAIYLGQPEEITAHAQEFVAGILNKISKLPIDRQLIQIELALRTVHKTSNYAIMKSEDDASYKKVLKKYLKSVYQALDSYRDSLELP